MSLFVRIGTQTFKYYNGFLEKRPVLTKSVTSGAMYAGGDAIAQYVEHYKANEEIPKKEQVEFTLNRKRLLVFFIYGTCVAGPVYHYWFNYLNELPQVLWRLKQSRQRGNILRAYAYLRSHNIEVKLDMSKLPVAAPLSKWKNKAAKIAADQLIFSSLYTLAFFMGVGVLNGGLDRLELWYEQTKHSSAHHNNHHRHKHDHSNPSSSPSSSSAGMKTENQGGPDNNTSNTNNNSSSNYSVLIGRLKDFLQEQEDVFYGNNPNGEEEEEAGVEGSNNNNNGVSLSSTKEGMTEDQFRLLEELLLRLEREEKIASQKLSWSTIVSNTWSHTKEVYWKTYVADCLVWPPLQLVNFTFIPVRYQFLYVNVANLAWNTFLSLMANDSSHGMPPATSNSTTNTGNTTNNTTK